MELVEACAGIGIIGAGQVFVGNGVAGGEDGGTDFGPGAGAAALAGKMRPGLLYGVNDDRRPAGAAVGY